MEVILLKDVAKVGRRFDIVTVADGFAIHCLIPQGLAQAATPAARALVLSQKAKLSQEKNAQQAQLAKCIAGINGKTVVMQEKANEQGHLFGSLHVERIASAIYDQLGVSIPPDCIRLEHPIKEIGETVITLGAGETTGTCTLKVEALK